MDLVQDLECLFADVDKVDRVCPMPRALAKLELHLPTNGLESHVTNAEHLLQVEKMGLFSVFNFCYLNWAESLSRKHMSSTKYVQLP